MSKTAKEIQAKKEARDRYFAELDQMEDDLGGVLVAGPIQETTGRDRLSSNSQYRG